MEELILANSQLQFGKYRGKTFRWLLENDVGYAVRLVSSIEIGRLWEQAPAECQQAKVC